jgi:hypothetical protein
MTRIRHLRDVTLGDVADVGGKNAPLGSSCGSSPRWACASLTDLP